MKNFIKSDYDNKLVNLHIHSTFSDGKSDFEDIVNYAKQKGMKKIAITDHNTLAGHKIYKDEILMTGVEFDCWYCGVFIHLLAYDIDVNNKDLEKFLAKNKAETEGDFVRLFSKRNVPDLIKTIHNAGGIAVLAHPACYWAINLEHFVKKLIDCGLDGIEVYYPYPRFRRFVKFHSEKDVLNIAEKFSNLIKTGGTDFHGKFLNEM